MFLAQSSVKPFLENNLDVLQFELFEQDATSKAKGKFKLGHYHGIDIQSGK